MGEGHVGAQTGKGRRKREKDGGLDLNVPQVAGSAVAAVVAAKLASNLGVYGTITGAGVVSALGTCGGTILQHVFRRTGRQVHEVALQALPRTRQMPVQAAGTSPERWADGERAYLLEGPHLPTPEPSAADRPVASALDGAALDAALDPTRLLPRDASQNETLPAAFDPTRLLPQDASEEQTRLLASAAADASAAPGEDVAPAATGSDGIRLLPHSGLAGVPAGAYSSTTLHRVRRPGWKRPAVAVALAFGLTMGGITLYEAASGHTLSGHGHGTTIGNAFTGHTSSGSGHRTTPAPSETDTPSTPPTSGTGAPSTPPTAPPTTPDHRTTPPPSSPTNPVTRTPGTGGGSSDGSTGGTGSGSGGDHTAGPTPSATPSTSPSAGPGSAFDGTGTHP
jgi:hypothetical protein